MLLLYSQIIGPSGKSCTNFICQIANYPVDKIIRPLNNWGLYSNHKLYYLYTNQNTSFTLFIVSYPLRQYTTDLKHLTLSEGGGGGGIQNLCHSVMEIKTNQLILIVRSDITDITECIFCTWFCTVQEHLCVCRWP